MGLEGVVTTEQLSKKWDNMKRKYKELKCPGPGMEKEAAKGMVTWHWFSMLDKTLGDKFPLPSVAMTTEDSCASLSTKRVCLVQLGTDVLKLLPNTPLPENTETASEHSESGPGMHLGVEIASLRRERLGMERDQAEVEIASLRRERLGMERDQAEVERERLLLERERKLLERERAAMERDRTQLRRDWATVERDRTAVQRDKVRLEKDLASLERDKVAVAREREQLSKDHENNIAHSEANASTLEDRQKLRSLFEKLIEKF
ncbi:scaffold attachment factor B2 isoform X3 [Alosa sapidissima]|nr:scaffold attachment factor B2 isoform X3 [Alosa sapidissima]